MTNGAPTGILKGDDSKKEDRSVQFAEKIEERFPSEGKSVESDSYKIEGNGIDNGIISWHL